MGADIHSFAETRKYGKWEVVGDIFPLHEYAKKTHGPHPFDWRQYSMFSFLAGVRSDDGPMIREPRLSLPDDVSDEVREHYEQWASDAHTPTWLTLRELLDYKYDEVTRERLREDFFRDLDILKSLGDPDDVRVVFWFDN